MHTHLVSEDDLRDWLKYERQADIRAWLDDKSIWYVEGKGGRICTTVEAITAARAKRMAKSGRRVVHKEVTRAEFMALYEKPCQHKAGQLELAAAEIGKGMGRG